MKHLKPSLLLAATLSFGALQAQAEAADYLLATASTGGTYYPVGVALSTLVKVKLQPGEGIGMSAISSAGSGENVRLLAEDEAQFAILQGLYGYYAAKGEGPLAEAGAQANLRSVTMLWQNVEQFVVDAAAAPTGTMADFIALQGETVGLGAENSGTLGSNETILQGLGAELGDYKLFYGGYGPSAEALQNGQVRGISTPSGVPTGALSQLFATAGDKVKLLGFTADEATAADGGRDLWTPFVIPAGTYTGQEADVTTIAQPNFLATNADIPEENVYMITKAIYENLPFLQAIHPATLDMALEKAIAGMPLPLHPGAARYYQEQGIEIPARLIAN